MSCRRSGAAGWAKPGGASISIVFITNRSLRGVIPIAAYSVDVSLGKIVTLEEKRLTHGLGQGTGKTIAIIQPSWMASLAIEVISSSDKVFLYFRNSLLF